jgi:hypothetical protein
MFHRYTLIVLTCACLQGCFRSTIDVSKDDRYRGGYAVGDIYELRSDFPLYRYREDDTRSSRVDSKALGFAPTAGYHNEPAGELKAGTRLRVKEIKLVSAQIMPTYWVYFIVPLAEVTDGPRVKERVDLRGLSVQNDAELPRRPEMYGGGTFEPNPNALRRVTD